MSYTIQNNELCIELPLTEPTGMARVKQRKSIMELGQPVATRQRKFEPDFYLEWQIAYDTVESSRSYNGLSFIRTKQTDPTPQTKYVYELSDYLSSSIMCGLIPQAKIPEMISFGSSLNPADYIEAQYHPTRKESSFEFQGAMDFTIYNEELPVLIHDCGGTFIEMMVKPKQRAVGSQAMLFYDIPITKVSEWPDLKDRPANTKEKVTYVINQGNSAVLIQLVKCFMLASPQHNLDILAILKAIHESIKNR